MDYTPSSPGDQWDGDVEMGNESDEEMETVSQFVCRFCSPSDLFQQNDDEPLIISPMILPKVGSPTVYEPFELSQRRVFLAVPTKVYAETTYENLDIIKTKEGRLVELKSMNTVKFGKVVARKEAFDYAKTHNISPIATRWIEGKPGVRCRLVVQQVAAGKGLAANLGFSSATPSGECIRSLIAFVVQNDWSLYRILEFASTTRSKGCDPTSRRHLTIGETA